MKYLRRLFQISMLFSVCAALPASAYDDPCWVLRSTFCCSETPDFCQFFGGCGQCCGAVAGENTALDVLAHAKAGWGEDTLFGTETDPLECVFYAPICVPGPTCSTAANTTQRYCVGYLEPGGGHDCP